MADSATTADPGAHPAGRLQADLVLEGGGVKGIALVGAVEELVAHGYRFRRVAGTSAGALAGALVAGLEAAGEPLERLADIADTVDYRRFRDRGFPGSWLGPLGFLTDGLGVLFERGAYEGDYLRDWMAGVLGDLGVHTFADLRTDDPADDGRLHHRYRLVVTATDVSRKRLVHFPWDYPDYGLDPEAQPVADAVRASASLPYFFEPVDLRGPHGTSTLVDGGVLSNYPISVFDRDDDRPPRWPTIGVRLDALGLEGDAGPAEKVGDPVSLGVALVETAIEASQAEQVHEPCNIDRSVYVNTADIGAVDFDLGKADRERLRTAGRNAARRFLSAWDFERWLARCR